MSDARKPAARPGRKKRGLFYLVLLCLNLALVSAAYLGYTAYRTARVYDYVKSSRRGWAGHVHRADAELGFSPVSGSRGAHVFPIGPDIPMRYDREGFRVPVDDFVKPSAPRPLVMTLGCSFTYGDAIRAEDTYPYRVGRSLQGTTRNAGVCSYGLSQMLILARRLVPVHEPDYLLVQYSPWLVDRALSPFAPSYVGTLTNPYFHRAGDRFALQEPVFLTNGFDLPIDAYRHTSRGLLDAFSFYVNVGLPLFAHDDYHLLGYALDESTGRIPPPATDREGLIGYVYGEIGDVARQNGSVLVIVVLGDSAAPVRIDEAWFPADAVVVDAHAALLARLRRLKLHTARGYEREYAIWRGSPPRIVDYHPNEVAHRIIAEEVVDRIRKTGAAR